MLSSGAKPAIGSALMPSPPAIATASAIAMAQKRSFLTSRILARRRAPRPLGLMRRRRGRGELAHEARRLRDVQADVVDAELEQPLARGTDIVGARPHAHRDPGAG